MTQTATTAYQFQQASGDGYAVSWEFWPGAHPVVMAVNIQLQHQVVPYTRTTQGGQHLPKARKYRRSQQAIRNWVQGIMLQHGIPPFGETAHLALGVTFGLPERDAVRQDLGNLEKAIEDALQDALYPNDVAVWLRLEGGKKILTKGEEPWVNVTVRRLA